jgi:hypothetical protein
MSFRSRIMVCLAWGQLCVLVLNGTQAVADEAADLTARRLIERLASGNKPPPRDDGSGEVAPWPEDYKFELQANIYEAADALLKMGVGAVPELLRHLKDGRYSVTELSGTGATHNYSVGHECSRIIRLLLNAGTDPIWFGRGDRLRYPRDDDELAAWWKKYGARPLWKIQRDAIELELPDARDLLAHPGDFQPDMKEYLHGLETNLAQLNKTHEGLPVKYPRRKMLKKRW